jgi:hypothetical protein
LVKSRGEVCDLTCWRKERARRSEEMKVDLVIMVKANEPSYEEGYHNPLSPTKLICGEGNELDGKIQTKHMAE